MRPGRIASRDIEVLQWDDLVHWTSIHAVIAALGQAAVLVCERVRLEAFDAERHFGKILKDRQVAWRQLRLHEWSRVPILPAGANLSDYLNRRRRLAFLFTQFG